MRLEQLVTVEVKVADDGHVNAHSREPVADVRDGGGGLVGVDGDAHQFGAGASQGFDLLGRGLDIGGVGVGHRLHDDRGGTADGD